MIKSVVPIRIRSTAHDSWCDIFEEYADSRAICLHRLLGGASLASGLLPAQIAS
jgi:hypothetical protein